jgi:hypothetical protein
MMQATGASWERWPERRRRPGTGNPNRTRPWKETGKGKNGERGVGLGLILGGYGAHICGGSFGVNNMKDEK